MSKDSPHSDSYRDMVLGTDDKSIAKHRKHIEETLAIYAGIQRRNAAAVKRNKAKEA
jgi:hypothetical protein